MYITDRTRYLCEGFFWFTVLIVGQLWLLMSVDINGIPFWEQPFHVQIVWALPWYLVLPPCGPREIMWMPLCMRIFFTLLAATDPETRTSGHLYRAPCAYVLRRQIERFRSYTRRGIKRRPRIARERVTIEPPIDYDE